MKTFLLFGILISFGCASLPKDYYQEGKGRKEMLRDKTECRALAGQAVPSGENRMHLFDTGTKRDDVFDECMEGRGWTAEE